MKMDLSICIVNHNAEKMLLNCLQSIYAKTLNISFEIIVVDNHSTDESVQLMKRHYPDVKLMENKKNKGFAAANNQAIKIAKGRYVLLLNNDTELINNAFDKMVVYMDQNPRIGILTCILYRSDKKTIDPNCRSFPLSPLNMLFARQSILSKIFPNNFLTAYYMLSGWQYDSPREIDWVSGACMLISHKVIEQIGLLDEKYFMYWEDMDYCKRIREREWKIEFIPDAEIIHYAAKGGGERGLGSRIYLIYQMHRSAYYYFMKHFYKSKLHPMAVLTYLGMVILVFTKSIIEACRYCFRMNAVSTKL